MVASSNLGLDTEFKLDLSVTKIRGPIRTNVIKTNVAWVNIQNTLDHLNLVDLGYIHAKI